MYSSNGFGKLGRFNFLDRSDTDLKRALLSPPASLSQTSGPDQMDGKQLEFTRIWPKIVINELKYVSFISLDLIRYSSHNPRFDPLHVEIHADERLRIIISNV